LTASVELLQQAAQKRLVRRSAGELPAATQQQRLLQGTLELPMALFRVAVFVGLARLDCLATQAIMPQQALVAFVERGPVASRRHRGRQTIRPM
jgi:hypothetical protein